MNGGVDKRINLEILNNRIHLFDPFTKRNNKEGLDNLNDNPLDRLYNIFQVLEGGDGLIKFLFIVNNNNTQVETDEMKLRELQKI